MLSVSARGVTVLEEQSSVSFGGWGMSALLKPNKCKNNSSSLESLRR